MKKLIIIVALACAMTGCQKAQNQNEANWIRQNMQQEVATPGATQTPSPTTEPGATPTLIPLYIGENAIDFLYPDLYTTQDVYDIRDMTQKYVEAAYNTDSHSDLDSIKEVLDECFYSKESSKAEYNAIVKSVNKGEKWVLKSFTFLYAVEYEGDLYTVSKTKYKTDDGEIDEPLTLKIGKHDGKWYITQ